MASIRSVSSGILLFSLSITGNAFATQCDELDANADTDAYYTLSANKLDDATQLSIHKFADQLQGNWRGTGIEVECSTSNGESHSTITNYEIDAEIDQNFHGSIVLRAEKETQHKVNLENIFISPELEKQRQGLETGYRSYSVDFSSPTDLVFEEKYRVHNVTARTRPNWLSPHAQRMIHETKTVSLKSDQLVINRDLYVNGYFVSQQQWELKKTP